jgi:hypothetical protein
MQQRNGGTFIRTITNLGRSATAGSREIGNSTLMTSSDD